MSKLFKIIIVIILIAGVLLYYLAHITDDEKLYRTFSPAGEYSIYASRYTYLKALSYGFPASRFGDAPGRLYLVDEVTQNIISSCDLGMVENIKDIEWHDTFVANKADIHIDLPKPLTKEIIPHGYIKVMETYGDLDYDNYPEKVVLYESSKPVEGYMPKAMALHIQKNKQGQWETFRTSQHAVIPNVSGHFYFECNIAIENQRLYIDHKETVEKLSKTTDTYKFIDNDFVLMAYERFYGKNDKGHYLNHDYYNFETNKVTLKRDSTHWKKQKLLSVKRSQIYESFNYALPKITFQNRYNGIPIQITSPEHKLKTML